MKSLTRKFILYLFLSLVMSVYIKNSGGGGGRLPQNYITLILISSAIVSLTLCLKKHISLSPVSVVLVVIGFLLTFSFCFSESYLVLRNYIHLIVFWVGVAYFIILSQFVSNEKVTLDIVMYFVFFAFIQTCFSIISLYYRNVCPPFFCYPVFEGRTGGVFQQVNVMASFVATAISFCSYFYFHVLSKATHHFIILTVTAFFSCFLFSLQSRTGYIAMFFVVLYSLYMITKQRKKALIFIIIISSAFFLWFFSFNNEIVNHDNSTNSRISIIKDTLSLISLNPFKGYGYGSFESVFQSYRLYKSISTIGSGVITHPHNEVLFLWFQAGALGLLSSCMIIILLAYMFLISYRSHSDKKNFVNNHLGWGVTTIPILIHTQTEFPFYISIFHFFLLLTILSIWSNMIFSQRTQ
ncbi:O-antigen ligase family protein [Enterobacter kobei]|uniref:O-antigen ligase family protein n=1 Tax=Enterobacter kobei TaxID=208224 RepID=UPI003A0FC5FC